MSQFLDSVTAVIAVRDLTASRRWYEHILGPATAEPDALTAEWKIANDAWIRVTQDKERAGNSIVAIRTSNLTEQVKLYEGRAVLPIEIEDLGYARRAVAVDPDGNQIHFLEGI